MCNVYCLSLLFEDFIKVYEAYPSLGDSNYSVFCLYFFVRGLIIDLSISCDPMNKVLTLVKVSVSTARDAG